MANFLQEKPIIFTLVIITALICYWGYQRTRQEKAICFYNFWDIFVVYATLIAVLFDFNHYRVNFIKGYVVYNLAVALVLNLKNPLDILCIGITRTVIPPVLGGFFLLSLFVKSIRSDNIGGFLNSLIQGKRVILMRKMREALEEAEEVSRVFEEHLKNQQGAEASEQFSEDHAVIEEEVDERSPYEILGVSRDATSEQIRAAFKKKMLENHPDRTGGLDEEFKKLAEKRMKDINSAYDTLRKKAT